MANGQSAIYIGTILLEPNRWASPKTPTYQVSRWLDRFAEAGFEGMELWEYHATLCSEEERLALAESTFPIAVYNTYCDFDDASRADRDLAARMIHRFHPWGVKYNVGREPGLRDAYIRNLIAWREILPDGCTPLCECHPGTIIEEPATARSFFDDCGEGLGKIIVHGFTPDTGRLAEWFEKFGPDIAHAHVQIADDRGGRDLLRSHPDHVREVLHIMKGEGFSGSFTLEFTRGTRAPDENIDDLWQAACDDLAFLREGLA